MQAEAEHVLQVQIGMMQAIGIRHGDVARQAAGQGEDDVALRGGLGFTGIDGAEQDDLQCGNTEARSVIERDRREHGEDVLHEVILQISALGWGQFCRAEPSDAFLLEQRDELLAENLMLPADEGGGAIMDAIPLQAGCQAAEIFGPQAFFTHELKSADTHHEEFIKVRGGDGQELHALQHGQLSTGRLIEHAFIEGEPAEFAIEKMVFRGGHETQTDAGRASGQV